MLINLIAWEKENGYKARWVAEKLGLTEAQYSKMKSGKRKPTIEDAWKFQEEFEVDDVINLLRKDTTDEK